MQPLFYCATQSFNTFSHQGEHKIWNGPATGVDILGLAIFNTLSNHLCTTLCQVLHLVAQVAKVRPLSVCYWDRWKEKDDWLFCQLHQTPTLTFFLFCHFLKTSICKKVIRGVLQKNPKVQTLAEQRGREVGPLHRSLNFLI